MKKFPFLLIGIFMMAAANGQHKLFKDSVIVYTKIWSRDSMRNIQYSDWKPFVSHTLPMLKNFQAQKPSLDIYGGDASIQKQATGFFRTEKMEGRWYIIDPLGHPFISVGVTSFRQGKSPGNMAAFNQKFGTNQNWVERSAELFRDLGFNCTGSWGETGMIIEYNKKSTTPLAYTTQLNLLSSYIREAKKKDPSRKESSALYFILDPAFIPFCQEETKKLGEYKNDPNLLGHFSDNEIAFTRSEWRSIINDTNSTDPGYLALKKMMGAEGKLSMRSEEEGLGKLAETYYATVSAAIKKNDPNHLYIGSRLHSTAKDNAFLFKALKPYLDIISINYYGYWQPQEHHINDWAQWTDKPFFITEFYTKAEDAGLTNISGAGWLVHTQEDRGIHYQNFCMQLLMAKNCVGWHWFRYIDNDPKDPSSDPSNNDSNKGIVNNAYEPYPVLIEKMKSLNQQKYFLIKYFDKNSK